MGRVLKALGMVSGAFLVFVGLLHVVLFARGRHTPEAMGAFHDWPVVGGFFPRHDPGPPPQTAEERREADAVAWLRDSRNEFRLPPPFTTEQIEALVRELKDAKTQAEAAKARYEAEQGDLDRVKREVESNRQALNAAADTLEAKSRELMAARDELDRYRTFVGEEEMKNFKTLAAMYEAMPAEDAASKLALLDPDVVAKVVSRMSERKAGRVLAAMDTPKAVAITKRLQALASAATPSGAPRPR
jgi:flagellar motility protein MotE (MotC chaperone)